MADAQKVIELIFQGVDKTGAATLSALDNAQKFSGSIQSVTQPIADFTVGALKLEAGLLAAGAAIVAFSVKSASDFDSAFRQISTIIDASDEDLDKFKQAILDYAGTSTQPLEQITNALGAAIGSGVDWAQSLDLISTAEKLAVSTRSDLDSTTKVLVSTLNSYGMNISEAGKVSDLFFKIIDEGDISMTDLANSFAKVAPIAKISGVSLEEVGAAIATLTASGIKPAESIEYLRGAISNIISPTKQAQDLSAELGIQFNAAGLKANGLAGLLQLVAEKTGGSADKMKILFGDIGGFTAAATLAGPQAQKFTENVAAMGNAAGATDEAFKKVVGSLENSTKVITNSFIAMAAAIGQPLLDEFGGIANAIASIFQALGASAKDGALGELVKYIESNLKALQTTIETVAKNLPAALAQADFSGFQRGIDAVVNAFKALFGGIDLSTVDGLTRAIEVAGAAFLGLSKYTAGVIESFKPLFDLLVKVGSEATSINPDILQMAGNFAGFAAQLNVLAGGLAGLMPWLETLVGLLIARQGLSLLAGMQALVAAAPAFAAALGPALIGASVIYTASQVGEVIVNLGRLYDARQKLADAQKNSIYNSDKEAEAIRRFAESTGIAAKSIEEINGLIKNGSVVYDDATNRWVDASKAMRGVGEETAKTGGYFSTVKGQWVDLTESSKEADKAWGQSKVALELQAAALVNAGKSSKQTALELAELRYSQAGLLASGEKVVPILDALTGKVVGYEKASVAASSATDKTAASLDKNAEKAEKARQEAEKLALEWEKIASNERIRIIEATFKFNTAQLEQDTKRIEATFKSIDNTVNSTGELIGDLFGILKDYDNLSFGAIRLIEKQLEAENKMRQEAFTLQKSLTETQIEYMRAQLSSMRNGEGFIKIDGAGLKPHLEAFMWEILKAIQIRTNKDGLKMLLGV